jgi:hypothetical protein
VPQIPKIKIYNAWQMIKDTAKRSGMCGMCDQEDEGERNVERARLRKEKKRMESVKGQLSIHT